MGRISILVAESALADLEALRVWYTSQGVPDVGERLVSEMVKRIETLSEHPDMGRVVPEFSQKSLRELIHPPYRIVYRRELSQIRIVRVWRSERVLELSDDEGR